MCWRLKSALHRSPLWEGVGVLNKGSPITCTAVCRKPNRKWWTQVSQSTKHFIKNIALLWEPWKIIVWYMYTLKMKWETNICIQKEIFSISQLARRPGRYCVFFPVNQQWLRTAFNFWKQCCFSVAIYFSETRSFMPSTISLFAKAAAVQAIWTIWVITVKVRFLNNAWCMVLISHFKICVYNHKIIVSVW